MCDPKIPNIVTIHSSEKEENYDYHAKCPECNSIIFRGNFCSNCGVMTVWKIDEKMKKEDFPKEVREHV